MSVLNLQPLGSPWGVLHGGAPTHRWWPRCVASSCPAPRRADWPTGPIYSQTAVCPPADGGAAPKIRVNPDVADAAPETFNVVIEIPMNADPIKYEVDKESGAIFVDRFMTTAMHYPTNYGYVP